MRQGAGWIASGLLTGIIGARLLTGYLEGLLFRVTQNDVNDVVSGLPWSDRDRAVATAIPALRASRIDPMLLAQSRVVVPR